MRFCELRTLPFHLSSIPPFHQINRLTDVNRISTARQPEFVERSIFYLCRAISSSMAKGQRKYRILPTYSVNLLDECRISKMNEMEKKDYDKSVMEYEGVREAVAFAKELAAEEAFGKGMEKGMEKGIEKGRAEGMEKGREEATILIARNLLKKGLDVPTIVAATGLTEQEVIQLTV